MVNEFRHLPFQMTSATPSNQLKEFIESTQPIRDGLRLVDDLYGSGYTTNRLITDMNPWLPSEDDRVRFRATSLLAYALQNKSLEGVHKDAVVDYLTTRLIDNECLEPILSALNFLVTERPSNEILQEMGDAFSTVHTQLLSKEIRLELYKFFRKFLKYVQGQEAIEISVQLIELERDPDCLLETFAIIKDVSEANDIDAETAPLLFDCASAYFPILYPPRGDESLRVKLTQAILDAFTSNKIYAQLTLPFLMDKLDADLSSIKLEAVRAIEHCLTHYQPSLVSGYYEHIWDAIEQGVSTAGVVELNKAAYSLTSILCSVEEKYAAAIRQNVVKFCLRMMSETDEYIIAFVDGLLEELTSTSEEFFRLFAVTYMKCFHSQLEDSSSRPRAVFERELTIVRLIYQRVVEGRPLLDELKGRVAWDIHTLVTPSHPCYVSLLDIDISLSFLGLVGDDKLRPYREAIDLVKTDCASAVTLLERLYEHDEATMNELLPASTVIHNLELLSGVGTHSQRLFQEVLLMIPSMQSSEQVPILQSLLSEAVPESFMRLYVGAIVPVFVEITGRTLSPLFQTLLNRLNRLHSCIGKELMGELAETVLSNLHDHPRLLLVLSVILPYATPDNLLDKLLTVPCVDDDTVSIYSLLVTKLTDAMPEALNGYREYYEGYHTIVELSQKKGTHHTEVFSRLVCQMDNAAIHCLRKMLTFDSIEKGLVLSWREALFDAVYDSFIAAHTVESAQEAHVLILLFSLLPVDRLMAYEATVLKVFTIICVPTSTVEAIDSAVSLLYSILPSVSQYPMSIIESELNTIIYSLFDVMYISGTTIKHRCDVLGLLIRMRLVYGLESLRQYKKIVSRKLLVPLDDSKRAVRQTAAVCRTIWETTTA